MNPIQKQQQKELEKIEICIDILKNARNELYLSMRFFDVILSGFEFLPDTKISGMGTDGFTVYFYPDYLIGLYQRTPVQVNRAYLHMIFHCLFGHLKQPDHTDEQYWNLACDIVVESIIDELNEHSVRKYVPPYRKGVYQKLREKMEVLTPKGVYRELLGMHLEEEHFGKMQEEFFVDDHVLWNENVSPEKCIEREKKWKEQNEKLQTEMETFSKEASENAENILNQVQIENRNRYDYRKFLEKFAILKEEMQVDQDSFDYIFYNYGMEHYGNLPLIEPLEYKEVNRLEELVIAIDTSGSCDGETVRRFLGETYSILSEKENFFHKMKVYLIQCDCCIQDVKVIHSEEEWKEYSKNITIQGRGGTDFRPVFRYVKEQQEKKEIRSLKALIYFTDGDGIYPGSKPDYETAFVFLHKTEKMELVPPWAIRLVAEQEGVRYRT